MREYTHTGYLHNTIRMKSGPTDEIYLNCSHIVITTEWSEGYLVKGWELLLVTGETIRVHCHDMSDSGIPEAMQAENPRGVSTSSPALRGLWSCQRTRGLPLVRGNWPNARPAGWCRGTLCDLRARIARAARPCPPSG